MLIKIMAVAWILYVLQFFIIVTEFGFPPKMEKPDKLVHKIFYDVFIILFLPNFRPVLAITYLILLPFFIYVVSHASKFIF